MRERAEKLLKTMLGADTTFRDGQWEAIKTVAVKKEPCPDSSAYRVGQEYCIFYRYQIA